MQTLFYKTNRVIWPDYNPGGVIVQVQNWFSNV